MSKEDRANKFRIKLGIPSVIEAEYVREWKSPADDNVVCYGNQVAIRTCDGTYWQVNRDDNDTVMACHRHVRGWEIFEIVMASDPFVSEKDRPVQYNDLVAFRSLDSGSFVGANLNEQGGNLTARVPWVKGWETFTLLQHPSKPVGKNNLVRYGTWFALRATNGKHVMFDRDVSRLMVACSLHLDELEEFVFIHPSFPK